MKLKTQNNHWSCLLYSYAMVLDVEPETLIDMIGHDGSEIIFPKKLEPTNRRGFHYQELFDCAFNLGYSVMEIQVLPTSITTLDTELFEIDFRITNEQRFLEYIKDRVGVFNGMALQHNHAVAWDGSTIYDPRGRIATYSNAGLAIRNFHLISKIDIPKTQAELAEMALAK
jgi:hypothetical protein